MNCPRCPQAAMFEKDRQGITVDVCPTCRGIFLDRGELEKLLSFAANDTEGRPRPVEQPRDYDREPPSSDFGRKRHPSAHRKEGFLARLGDLFD